MSTPGKVLQNTILVLLSLLFSFFCVEWILRLAHIEDTYGYPEGLYMNDPLLGYKMAPKIEGTLIKPEFATFVHTNSLGLRDREYESKRPSDYRILALGDSFTWGGYGTQLNETFIKIVEQKLNGSLEQNIQVINSGVPGYGIEQESLYAQSEGIKLEPDMILLNFYVGNDFTGKFLAEKAPKANEKGQLVSLNSMPLRNFLLEHLHSFRFFERRILPFFGGVIENYFPNILDSSGKTGDIYKIKYDRGTESRVKNTLGAIGKLNLYCKDNNIELMVVVIPTIFQVYDNVKESFIRASMLGKDDFDFNKPQALLKEFFLRENIEFIDLLPEFKKLSSNHDLYWSLNPHFNKKGNEIAAKIIFNRLKDFIPRRGDNT